MHKIQAKEFTLDDFSCEHLNRIGTIDPNDGVKSHMTMIKED